jgi:predicted transcriptional regulator
MINTKPELTIDEVLQAEINKALIHTVKIDAPAKAQTVRYPKKPVILRQVIGEELRRRRMEQKRTLRQVSNLAQVSLGYLSEVERGQKEASSELLASIANALDTPLSELLAGVAKEVARLEDIQTIQKDFSVI